MSPFRVHADTIPGSVNKADTQVTFIHPAQMTNLPIRIHKSPRAVCFYCTTFSGGRDARPAMTYAGLRRKATLTLRGNAINRTNPIVELKKAVLWWQQTQWKKCSIFKTILCCIWGHFQAFLLVLYIYLNFFTPEKDCLWPGRKFWVLTIAGWSPIMMP